MFALDIVVIDLPAFLFWQRLCIIYCCIETVNSYHYPTTVVPGYLSSYVNYLVIATVHQFAVCAVDV